LKSSKPARCLQASGVIGIETMTAGPGEVIGRGEQPPCWRPSHGNCAGLSCECNAGPRP